MSRVRVQDLRGAVTEEISPQRLQGIRDAVGVEEVPRSAIQRIGWEDSVGEFNRSMGVENGNEGELNVAFSAGTPELAAEEGNAYSRVLVFQVENLNESRLAMDAINAGTELTREGAALAHLRGEPDGGRGFPGAHPRACRWWCFGTVAAWRRCPPARRPGCRAYAWRAGTRRHTRARVSRAGGRGG